MVEPKFKNTVVGNGKQPKERGRYKEDGKKRENKFFKGTVGDFHHI